MNSSFALSCLKTSRLALAKLRKSETISRTELEVLANCKQFGYGITFTGLKSLCPSINIQQLRRAVNRLAQYDFLFASKIDGHPNAKVFRLTRKGAEILNRFELHCREMDQGFLSSLFPGFDL